MTATIEARLVWIDGEGFIHERKPGSDIARCGAEYSGMSHGWSFPRACIDCINDALREYALTHDCRESGCVAAACSGSHGFDASGSSRGAQEQHDLGAPG